MYFNLNIVTEKKAVLILSQKWSQNLDAKFLSQKLLKLKLLKYR